MFWSIIYRFILLSIKFARIKPVGKLWTKIWASTSKYIHVPIKTVIHGESVIINYGNSYPVNCRIHTDFNNPLLEIVYQVHREKKNPIRIIDVGAAVGDTVLLLKANCGGMIEHFSCVDGDAEFFAYLRYNTRNIPNCLLYHVLLSSGEGAIRELVRTHGGTASAQGDNLIPAIPLDSLREKIGRVDLLKIDVDGFDGEVISGAREILTKDRPAVIFEWHPKLCVKTGNDFLKHFSVLSECGYDRFLWYANEGDFSHFMYGFDEKSTQTLAQLCIHTASDLHFDIIALHRGSAIPLIELAEMDFAKNKQSRY